MGCLNPHWNCYGYVVRKGTEYESARDITHKKTMKLELISSISGNTITLVKRNRDFSQHFSLYYKLSKPYVLYGTFSGGEGPVQEGDPEGSKTTISGSIKEDWRFTDNTIIYMDLREDIVVLNTTEGSVKYEESNDKSIGNALVDFGTGAKYTNISSVVGVCPQITKESQLTEHLYAPLHQHDIAHNKTTGGNITCMGLHNFDPIDTGSGSGGTTTFVFWGGFTVLDKTYYYPEDEAKAQDMYEYSQMHFGENQAIDQYFIDAFNACWRQKVTKTGTVGIPYSAEQMPQGSWTVDSSGNYFFSQMTVDGTYNYLTEGDATSVTKTEGSNPVYFPVAPF